MEITNSKDLKVTRFNEIIKTFKKYQDEKANILPAGIGIETLDPYGMYVPVVETLTLDPDPRGTDFYPSGTDGKSRLHNFAVEKLCNAANVKWDPVNSTVKTQIPGKYVLFQAVGCLQKSDGDLMSAVGHGEMDMEVVKEDLVDEYENKAKTYQKNKSDKEKKEYVNYCVNRDFREKRKHMVPLAESKAKGRVGRKLLNIKNEYTAALFPDG